MPTPKTNTHHMKTRSKKRDEDKKRSEDNATRDMDDRFFYSITGAPDKPKQCNGVGCTVSGGRRRKSRKSRKSRKLRK